MGFQLQCTGLDKVRLGQNSPIIPRGRPASIRAALMHFYAVASSGFVTGRSKAYRTMVRTGKFGDVVAVAIGEDPISNWHTFKLEQS